MKYIFIICIILSCNTQNNNVQNAEIETEDFNFNNALPDVPEYLSEYKLFAEPLSSIIPVSGVVPYDLNAALFSDYAFKKRFLYIPESESMQYHCEEVFDFPDGSLIFKFFYYPKDFRRPDENIRIMETRVLHKKIGEWTAHTYIWDAEQKDARLALAGDNLPVSWTDSDGKLQHINYSVPNVIQCKHCHEKAGLLIPIGPAGKHLHKDYTFSNVQVEQLKYFTEIGILKGWNSEVNCRALINYETDNSVSLNDRARSYLDINCAHCHRHDGSARNSGLYLTFEENDPYRLGVYKPPVAAGRGSGGLKFDITPGKSHESILLYRMQSLEPGVMMPESGRQMAHSEGVILIREWIENFK